MTKMTAERVVQIREQYAAGWVMLRELAEEHGVSIPTVWQIVHRGTWRHIPPVPGEVESRGRADRIAERDRETSEMAALRAEGMTWQAIGDRYGMTLQGARQRVAKHDRR
jgi:hypothetical protein